MKSNAKQFIFFMVFSTILMVSDSYSHGRNLIKSYITAISKPVYYAISYPEILSQKLNSWFTTQHQYNLQVEQLKLQNSILKVKLYQMQNAISVQQKNETLSTAATKFARKMRVASVLAVSPDRSAHKLVLDKGLNDSVYLGQPVVDEYGVLGQITELSVTYSVVTLITDATQSTPIMVKRNSLRTLLNGVGNVDHLTVKFLSAEADIKVGDELVSSGIGNRFPAGYPIAIVNQVNNDPNESFLNVSAKPVSHLAHGEQVLLLWPTKNETDQKSPLKDNPGLLSNHLRISNKLENANE